MTAIEWTDVTWNPVTGCSLVSPGCDNCYAAREAAGRLSGHDAYRGLAVRPVVGGPAQFTGELRLHPDRLDQPSRWRKPRMVFVNSMSDLFHRDLPLSFLEQVWRSMVAAPHHTYQILTKRPERIATALGPEGIAWYTVEAPVLRPQPGIWIGTSIETDRYTFRAGHLRSTPAAVRFLSLEPLLGPLPSLNLDGINWVIAGGESGPGARPMHPDWVRDIRDRCITAGIPFFFKQWGEYRYVEEAHAPGSSDRFPSRPWIAVRPSGHHGVDLIAATGDAVMQRVGKKRAGRQLDGRTWDEMPEAVA